MNTHDLSGWPPRKLLALYRAILTELKEQQIIRANNAPTGDYAELLVQRATDATLAPQSQKGWDLQLPDGAQWQVKSRVLSQPSTRGERQLSPFNSWDFDQGMIVLFDEDFTVRQAALLPVADLKDSASVGGVVVATNELFGRGVDWTA